ncbi:universal stress protein [Desulfospira joergensenii]|uniref:universal stress protein n=1 Tax=Desulfospira joergensenii TaxID=53329 RepID=UPI0003B5B45E|nr:universal stress protein [Desulfospira joergensenii]
MKNEVLVIFENEKVYPGALIYAREYALRTDAKVTFLMLVAMSFSTQDGIGAKRNALHKIEARVGKRLAELTETFIQKGLETSSALKIGDPSQELLKFLADRPSFQAIVWGSGQDFSTSGKSRGRHWLKNLSSGLECPLLTLSRRKKNKH